ncbi:MAG: GNAT family N-acetyltransferase [Pseudomonadota bacterium]
MSKIRVETERLVLRPFEAQDVEPHIAMMADPEVCAYLTPGGTPRAYGEEWRAAACYVGHWSIRGYGFFSVEEKSTGEWIGRVGPWQPGGWPGLECGWSLASAHWGKGYAPEAVIGAIRWTFERFPDLARIISVIAPENANSQAVAAKVGETKTDEIFEFWGSRLDIWAAEREAWLAEFG